MKNLLIIGAGGFAGSILRYLLAGAVQSLSGSAAFPYGTLAVNLVGCLGIGLLGGWADNYEVLSAQARLFLMIGLLGGFTTYSSFAYESMQLLRDGEALRACANVLLHVLAGFAAVWLGYALSTLR